MLKAKGRTLFEIVGLVGTGAMPSEDLNEIRTPGIYFCSNSGTDIYQNGPANFSNFALPTLIVLPARSTGTELDILYQIILTNDTSGNYKRAWTGWQGWQAWKAM